VRAAIRTRKGKAADVLDREGNGARLAARTPHCTEFPDEQFFSAMGLVGCPVSLVTGS
jgi:hypothetical protein